MKEQLEVHKSELQKTVYGCCLQLKRVVIDIYCGSFMRGGGGRSKRIEKENMRVRE